MDDISQVSEEIYISLALIQKDDKKRYGKLQKKWIMTKLRVTKITPLQCQRNKSF